MHRNKVLRRAAEQVSRSSLWSCVGVVFGFLAASPHQAPSDPMFLGSFGSKPDGTSTFGRCTAQVLSLFVRLLRNVDAPTATDTLLVLGLAEHAADVHKLVVREANRRRDGQQLVPRARRPGGDRAAAVARELPVQLAVLR